MESDKVQLFEDQPIRTAWVEEEEEWYLYTSGKQWLELYQMVIDNLTAEIERYKNRMKQLEG